MKALVFALALVATPTLAQQPEPFTPYTIGQQEHQWLMNALGEVQAKHALPIMQALSQLEQQARAKAREAKPKPGETK